MMATKFFVERGRRGAELLIISGWGNGYVCLPLGHPFHSMPYDDINVDVHGGLTFAALGANCNFRNRPEGTDDWWIVGFDTMHFGDCPELWPKARVIHETLMLQKQLESARCFCFSVS